MEVRNSMEIVCVWKLEMVWKMCGNDMEIVWNGTEFYWNQPLYIVDVCMYNLNVTIFAILPKHCKMVINGV